MIIGLGGCGRTDGKSVQAMPPPTVGIVTIHPEPVSLSTELPGRTNPYEIAEVRPQVGGILLKRLFREGADVTAGQPLYQIDSALNQASFDQAKAQLAYAEANVETTRLKAERYADLAKMKGVSKQDADDAAAAYHQAVALVAEDRAMLDTARVNLGYTTITAPIGGRIGSSSFTQGALVTAGQASALATIQRLDPIYVDITESTTELLHQRRNQAAGTLKKAPDEATKIRLKLDDGSDYPIEGTLQFTDVTVDQSTGSVTLRAVVPNPDRVLLPGMFVRAIVPEGTDDTAILAPQQGVTREPTGQASVMLVDAGGKVAPQAIDATRIVGDKWLVTKGLKDGDRIVVEGLQKVRPGATVTMVAAGASQASAGGPPSSASTAQ